MTFAVESSNDVSARPKEKVQEIAGDKLWDPQTLIRFSPRQT